MAKISRSVSNKDKQTRNKLLTGECNTELLVLVESLNKLTINTTPKLNKVLSSMALLKLFITDGAHEGDLFTVMKQYIKLNPNEFNFIKSSLGKTVLNKDGTEFSRSIVSLINCNKDTFITCRSNIDWGIFTKLSNILKKYF
jgi:hypothetical protein